MTALTDPEIRDWYDAYFVATIRTYGGGLSLDKLISYVPRHEVHAALTPDDARAILLARLKSAHKRRVVEYVIRHREYVVGRGRVAA